MAVVTLGAWAALTWPLALHLDGIWAHYAIGDPGDDPVARYQPELFVGNDPLQSAFIQTVVIDNVRHLRNPYLDLYEGAACPVSLRTSSLDLPWTPLVAVLWPLVGLQAAYNATLVLSTLATGLAAFGWLRRHTRWQMLAGAGALAYTFTLSDFSDLVAAASSPGPQPSPEGSRLADLVRLAAAHRGMSRPRPAVEVDLVDPYRRSDATFRQMVRHVSSILPPVIYALSAAVATNAEIPRRMLHGVI